MPKNTLFLSTFFIISLFIAYVFGSSFVYLSGNTILNPTPPDVIFHQSMASGVSSLLGPNKTYADVTVKASTSPFEVTVNGGFDSGPSPWTFSSGSNITSAYWYPTLYGRNGVIRINGSFVSWTFTSDNARILEVITWPSTPLSSASLNISYRIIRSGAILLGLFYIDYIITDLALNVITQGNIVLVAGAGDTLWQNTVIPLNTALFNPGNNYYLFIEVGATSLFGLTNIDVEYVIDYSIITATPTKPYFIGPILHLNTSISSYYVSITVNSINSTGNANVSLWLRNHTITVDSTKIVIENSVLINGQTSEVIVAPVGLGYYGIDVLMEAQLDPTSSITIDLTVKYRVEDNVHVEYQFIVTILDPPSRGETSRNHVINSPIPLAQYRGG